MKRIKNLSKLMLAVMTMLVMIACGSSSDDANNGAAYTPEEISAFKKITIYDEIILNPNLDDTD